MVVLWFVLALVLLAAALVLLRLDSRQRARQAAARGVGPGGGDPSGEDTRQEGDRAGEPGDDDETAESRADAAEEGSAERTGGRPDDEDAPDPGTPQLAPFQRGPDAEQDARAERDTDEPRDEAVARAEESGDTDGGTDEPADGVDPVVAAVVAGAAGAGAGVGAAAAPGLGGRVRAMLSRRRQSPTPTETAGDKAEGPVDPLADSPVVRWLEEREFEPTPTPAPDLRHGDFAHGLPELGTVSHGVFRGRRAIMGVSGGRAVLALRRDTASDVVLDLSRADVDAEPGFHDAGEVAALEARTSDVGRLDLVDRDRLADALRDLPSDVRRVWAEGEWVVATVDGAEDPSTWDDAVVALHSTADVLAPLPPVGGRARPLPADVDPGAPGAAEGPDADPAVGMDGAEGTGVGATGSRPGGDTASTAVTTTMPAFAAGADEPGADAQAEPAAGTGGARRAGHLRLVPDRRDGVRDLTDAPVVADRGDAGPPADDASTTDADDLTSAEPTEEEAATEEADPFAEIMEPSGPVEDRGDVASDHLAPRPPLSRPSRGAGQSFPEDASVPPLAAGVVAGGAGIKPIGSEDDEDEIRSEVERFDAARTDGGTDLDAASSGRHGSAGAGESGGDTVEETGGLSVADLAARLGAAPSTGRRHRRRRADDDETSGADAGGEEDAGDDHRERAGTDPDLEQTRSLKLPPDLGD